MKFSPLFMVALMLLLALPVASFASHRDSDVSRTSTRLGGSAVEEVPMPILFGLTHAMVRSDFGDPRDGGARSHEGQDLFAPMGTPIVSPTKAVVLSTGSGDTAGKYVYTANPGGERFAYMHLDAIAPLKRGQKLEAGAFIGTVGNTGNAISTPSHLHFEIRDGRKALDPYPRIVGTFTLKEKISFLDKVFNGIKNDDLYAESLSSYFIEDFKVALANNYEMPEALTDALRIKGYISQKEKEEKLIALFNKIPALLTPVALENRGPSVSLLQIYIIYTFSGPARDELALYGPTGLYGPVTMRAVTEYQVKEGLPATSVLDAATLAELRERELSSIPLLK